MRSSSTPQAMADVPPTSVTVMEGRGESATAAPISLTLFEIESEKLALIEFREECETDEERAACDQQIQAYVRQEIQKVSNIARLLRYFDSMVDACKSEQARIAKKRAKWEGCYGRLRQMALQAMVEIGKTKLEEATDRLRIQKNPPSVDVYDAAKVPDEYLKATIKLPFEEVRWLLAAARNMNLCTHNIVVTSEVDTAKLKNALAKGEVPGARLVQGEHLRIE